MSDIISHGTIILGILIALTNIIVEVAKNIVPLKSSEIINRVATCVGVVLTVAAGCGYCAYQGIALNVFMILAFMIAGVMVAYGSMFGFDKLLAYFENKDGDKA